MKLIRFGAPGRETPGVLLPDGTRRDVSAFGGDFDEAFFGTDGPGRLRAWLARNPSAPVVDPAERLGPPIVRPSKIV